MQFSFKSERVPWDLWDRNGTCSGWPGRIQSPCSWRWGTSEERKCDKQTRCRWDAIVANPNKTNTTLRQSCCVHEQSENENKNKYTAMKGSSKHKLSQSAVKRNRIEWRRWYLIVWHKHRETDWLLSWLTLISLVRQIHIKQPFYLCSMSSVWDQVTSSGEVVDCTEWYPYSHPYLPNMQESLWWPQNSQKTRKGPKWALLGLSILGTWPYCRNMTVQHGPKCRGHAAIVDLKHSFWGNEHTILILCWKTLIWILFYKCISLNPTHRTF